MAVNFDELMDDFCKALYEYSPIKNIDSLNARYIAHMFVRVLNSKDIMLVDAQAIKDTLKVTKKLVEKDNCDENQKIKYVEFSTGLFCKFYQTPDELQLLGDSYDKYVSSMVKDNFLGFLQDV